MKKFFAFLLAAAMLFSLVACSNNQTSTENNGGQIPSDTPKYDYDPTSLESMLTFLSTTGEAAVNDTEAEAQSLIGTLGESYDSYASNKAEVTEFYSRMATQSSDLYLAFQACSIDYFKCVASQGLDDYDTWDDAMEDFYDAWDDVMEEYYDAWDDAYGDIYDLCDDLISDASDDLDYKEYSDVWSAMYEEYSDAWSSMYKAYSDAWSKTYKDYSSCWSGFYKGSTDVDALLADAASEKDNTEDDDRDSSNSDNTDNADKDASEGTESYAELEERIEAAVSTSLTSLTSEWESLAAGMESYDTYMAKADAIAAFYEQLNSSSAELCIQMCQFSIDYAEAILSSGKSTDDMYSNLEGIYDLIYDDMGDEIYDGIYDGILDEMYDVLYSGALDERPDGVEYSDWSDARSKEYEMWSDTRSDTYEQWSDFRGDVYEFWSDMRSELYSDDIEAAQEVIAEFQEDVNKLLDKQANTNDVTEATEDVSGSDGIDPDFRAAMDSYEKFFDDYVIFMKAYKDADDVSSMANEYTAMMQQYLETMTALQGIDQGSLSDEDALYYAEVMLRINQKLLQVV